MSKSSDNPTGRCLSGAYRWHPIFEECIDPNSLHNVWKQQETSAGDKDSWAYRRNHKKTIKHEITTCPQTSLLIGLFWQPEFGKVTIRSQSCTTVSPFTCWSMPRTITVTPSITPKWGRLQDWAWRFHLTWRRHQRHICCVIDPAHLPFSVWLKKSSVRTDYCTA